MFRALDVKQDGVISFEEFSYGCVNWGFCSGPDSPFSLSFGPLVDE